MESMKNRMFWGLAVMLAVLSSCQKEDRPFGGERIPSDRFYARNSIGA